MQMESSRRPFDRSLVKESGLKKPRLIEEAAVPDRSSNGRSNNTGFIQRPAASNSGGGNRLQRDRDSESSDSVRGPYQQQPQNQELVAQYKTALAELTFNSKPIITNLSIIAGENLHAAKAIAAAICAHILEVPSEQKLPSLYLLDSIVKNIGRDYIKYFASRLPEVFCKAYRQVDPSVHPGMRHLFGTWKGVFPPQSLQMIEKELGFVPSANGLSSGTSSRPDSQAQRPGHSIHVNPKYLEARQRVQQSTRPRGAANDISGTVTSSGDVEKPRTTGIGAGRPWSDPIVKNIKQPYRDQMSVPIRDRNVNAPFGDPEDGSDISGRLGLGIGKGSERVEEQGVEEPWYESDLSVTDKISNQKNGFDMKSGFQNYPANRPVNSNSHTQLKPNLLNRSSSGISRSWKNSEEEEYVWDDMTSRSSDTGALDTARKDQWMLDDSGRVDFENHIGKPPNIHDIGSMVDDEASADSLSAELGQSNVVNRMTKPWSRELRPSEGMKHSGSATKLSGHFESHSSFGGIPRTANSVSRAPFQSHMPPHQGASSIRFSSNTMSGSAVSMSQPRQIPRAPSPSAQSPRHQRPPSPSMPVHNSNQMQPSQTSNLRPADPRKVLQKNIGSSNQFSKDSVSIPSQDTYVARSHRPQAPVLQTSSPRLPSSQQKLRVSPTPQLNPEQSDSESSGEGQKRLHPLVSRVEHRPTIGNLSSNQSSLAAESSGQSSTSILLAAVMKSGILGNSSLVSSLLKPSSEDAGSLQSQASSQPPLSSGPPPTLMLSSGPKTAAVTLAASSAMHGSTSVSAFSQGKVDVPPLPPGPPPLSTGPSAAEVPTVASTSNPVSSLLSSLISKGMISAPKTDSPAPASSQRSAQQRDQGPGVVSISSTIVSSGSVPLTKASVTTDESPSVKATSDNLQQPTTTKIRELIGFEFKPDIIREYHPEVVSDLLDDFPHRCSICSLKLKLQEQFDRHLEWHVLKTSTPHSSCETSRRWYANSVEWIAGSASVQSSNSGYPSESLDKLSESSGPMVPADESQCACILCGELFEDFYSQERDEWMFKGAVYLSDLPSEGNSSFTSDHSLGLIVHEACVSESSVGDLGLEKSIKVEKDA